MISIQIKMMGMLQGKTPESGVLELAEGATIRSALEHLGVEADSVHVFTINGELTRDKTSLLEDGVELVVLPPVGGG